MDEVADSVARWMGILTTGVLIGAEAEGSALRARRVLGGERLRELRRWFDAQPPEVVRDVKCAVVEACIAIAQADRVVTEREREMLDRMIDLAELDEVAAEWVRARIDAPQPLDVVIPRIAHPSLRELVLAIAWQLARADGKVAQAEHGAYGVLADVLGISPVRANELRQLLRED